MCVCALYTVYTKKHKSQFLDLSTNLAAKSPPPPWANPSGSRRKVSSSGVGHGSSEGWTETDLQMCKTHQKPWVSDGKIMGFP